MSQPPALAFGPAHKVVIDCLTLIAASFADDDRRPLALQIMADALPDALPCGQPAIDRLIATAPGLIAASAALAGQQPGRGATWGSAVMETQAALANFAWARLCQSAGALTPAPTPEGAANA